MRSRYRPTILAASVTLTTVIASPGTGRMLPVPHRQTGEIALQEEERS